MAERVGATLLERSMYMYVDLGMVSSLDFPF